MASWMRWLIGLVATAGLAFLAGNWIKLDTMRFSGEEWTLAHKQADSLGTEIRFARNGLRQIALEDTILRALAAPGDLRIIVPPGAKTSPEKLRVAYHSAIGTASTRARLVFAVLPAGFGGDSTFEALGLGMAEFFFGTAGNQPYCAAVHFTDHMGFINADTLIAGAFRGLASNGLTVPGPCMFWARYGRPGPRIERWLLGGGYRFADAMADPEDFVPPQYRHRGVFGVGGPVWYEITQTTERCLAGRPGACADPVLDTLQGNRRLGRRTPLIQSYFRNRYVYSTIGDSDRSLIADIERHFGHERFERFWQSPDDTQRAFASAFGVDLDTWIREWAQKRYGTDEAGPGMSIVTFLLTLLTLAVLFGAGVFISMRRQVR